MCPRFPSELGIRDAHFGNPCLRDFDVLDSERLEYGAVTNWKLIRL